MKKKSYYQVECKKNELRPNKKTEKINNNNYKLHRNSKKINLMLLIKIFEKKFNSLS